MNDDLMARIETMGALQRELGSLVNEGLWRQAAELAGALEIDLDALRASLRERHRAERMASSRAARRDRSASSALGAWAARRRSERPIAG